MSDSLYEIYVHIVFGVCKGSTVIPDIAIANLHGYVAKVFANKKCHDICVGGINNHIHVLTSLPKDTLVPEIIRSIKVATNKILSQKYGVEKFSWQKGYAAFSVGPREIQSVKKYIKNQKKHHLQTSYQKELEKLEILYNFLSH